MAESHLRFFLDQSDLIVGQAVQVVDEPVNLSVSRGELAPSHLIFIMR
jgi:hypothetical protein